MAVRPATGWQAGQECWFRLGDLPLRSGRVLPDARLSYQVFGQLNASRSNLVLLPSSYGAWPEDLSWTVGPILDPQRWCVVLVSQFGNGRSSSPSDAGPPLQPGGWPVDHSDNLRAQIRLLEEVFQVESPALIYGWSMGAQQAYHWAVLEPQRPRRICCLCGTARTTPHNRLFLLSLRQALTADPTWDGQRFRALPERGLRSFALIYASWAASQSFYRRGRHQQLGFASVEEYVERAWLPAYRRHDPHNLLGMLDVWLACDVAAALAAWPGAAADPADPADPADRADRADRASSSGAAAPDPLGRALGRIEARTSVIACRHDLYFTPEDCAHEASLIPSARWLLLESDLGHRAGNPRDDPALQAQIRAELEALCAA
jgi:homoserine O-acetyltransferase/O-succinyltransferase